MLGAAPTCKRYRGLASRYAILVLALAAQLVFAANALAAPRNTTQNIKPTPVWGIALDGRQPDEPDLELLSQAKAAGLNAIVTDPKRWSPSRHTRLVEMARQLGLLLIEPQRPAAGSANPQTSIAACQAKRRAHQPCAVVATSAREANAFARRTTADYVVVQLDTPSDLAQITASPSGAQVIGVVTVGAAPKLDAAWDRAIGSAAKDKRSTLAVGLSGAFAAAAVQNYFALLDKYSVTSRTFDGRLGADRLPPTTPLGGTVTSATTSTVNLSWLASTDNVGVAGYEVYVNGSLVGSTAATTFTVTGLACGSTYTFGVDAYDKRKNRSPQLLFTGSTAGCPAPPPAPAPQPTDTTPPTQPTGLSTTGTTTSSISLTWSPSMDNVGVAGYEITKGKSVVGTTSATSYLLAGLSCGTSYTYGVRAYDAAGNRSTAALITFSTSACAAAGDTVAPSIPGNFHVTGTTVSSISVAWDPSTDNVGVAGYGVYSNGTLAGSTNSTSYTVTGLSCGTTVSLALDAYDAAGNHSAQATLTASASACPSAADTTAPTTPSNLHASGATPTSVTIAWTASTDNVGVAGYTAYDGSATAGTTTSTSDTVSGLLCGATYDLSVDAFDAAGNRSSKATISSTTNACAPAPAPGDTQAPTTPTNLAVLNATTSSITVGWTASTDNVGVTGYGLYRGGSSTGSTTSTSATFSGLACGSAYVLAVDAYDAAGNRSNQATITASASPCQPASDTQAPTVPGGLQVTGSTGSSITVAWTASTDNVGVAGYGLYRAGSSTGSTTTTSATFSGLVCGTTYTLGVDAYDAAGNRSAQATISSPTSACPPPPPTSDTTAPTAPGNLAATGATTSSISVSWSASTDNVGVTGYGLYRSGTSTGSTTSTSASFTGLTCGTAYTLAVDAYDAAGNRSAKSSVTASTSACPPPADTQAPTTPGGLSATAATTSSITIGWTASTDNVGVTGYGLYRNGTSTGSTASTSASFSGLTCGTAYTLAVDAYDAAGNRSAKASITASTSACPPPADTQAPTAPAGLQATGTTATSVTVAWTASTDNVGVTGYTVYNGSATAGNTATTSYTVSGLSCGTSYTIAVDAYDAAGNRSGKATVSVTTAACSTPSVAGVSVSPSGNDSTCVRGDATKPCATISRAYSLAQGGDTINVACGTYGAQTVPSRSLGTNVVTIQKDPAGSCTYVTLTGGLSIQSSYVTVDGFQATNNDTIWVNAPNVSTCTVSHVTVQNFKASGIGGGCDHITFRHGDVGTNQNACTGGPEDGIQLMGPTPTGQFSDLIPPTNMLIDDVTVHDTTGYTACGSHTDGFQAFGCNSCTIRDSRFFRNDTSDVIIYQITGKSTDIQNILIENNSFGVVNNPGHGVSIGGQACSSNIPNNVVVQNNTFYTGVTGDINCVGGYVAGTWRNNVMAGGPGAIGSYNLAFDYNIWSSGAIGSHAKTCTPSFVDPSHANGNVDLNTSDTCAKDAVAMVSGTYPGTDMHGAARPQGTAVDAGADEAG